VIPFLWISDDSSIAEQEQFFRKLPKRIYANRHAMKMHRLQGFVTQEAAYLALAIATAKGSSKKRPTQLPTVLVRQQTFVWAVVGFDGVFLGFDVLHPMMKGIKPRWEPEAKNLCPRRKPHPVIGRILPIGIDTILVPGKQLSG
jgi:hypothetical protein